MEIIRKLGSLISTLIVTIMIFLAVMLVGVRLIGLTPYAVLSGSMEPTYHVGSLIYVKDVAPEDIVVGTPITFVVNEDLLLATHRVVGIDKRTTRFIEVLGEDGQPLLDTDGNPVYEEEPLEEPTYYFETKGDANESVDGALVHHKNVVGTPIFSIPYLGYLSNWLQTPKGMIMGASIALVLLILTFIPDLLNLVDDEPAKKAEPKKVKKEAKKKASKQSAKAQKSRRQTPEDEDDWLGPAPARRTRQAAGAEDQPAPAAEEQAELPTPPAGEEPPRRRRRRQAVDPQTGE